MRVDYNAYLPCSASDDIDKLRKLNYELISGLEVEDTSAFSSCLDAYTCTVMETVIFECEVKDSDTEVIWYKDGKAINLKDDADK